MGLIRRDPRTEAASLHLFISLMLPDYLQDHFSLCICSVLLSEKQNALDSEGDFIYGIAMLRTLTN